MGVLRPLPFVLLATTMAVVKPEIAKPRRLVLPGGGGGIGFDDLRFSPDLHRVLAPAGRTGKLDLIDPGTQTIESIEGFSSDARYGGGHGEGTTSVDGGGGLLFATDRGRAEVAVIDPKAKKITAATKLRSGLRAMGRAHPGGVGHRASQGLCTNVQFSCDRRSEAPHASTQGATPRHVRLEAARDPPRFHISARMPRRR